MITAPQRHGDLWDYVSPSRLKLWIECPAAFRRRYVEGIRPPASPSLFIGQMVHVGLAMYYRRRQRNVTLDACQLFEYVAARWDKAVEEAGVSFASSTDEQQARNQVERLLRAYVRHQQRPGHQEPRPLAVEKQLSFPLLDISTGASLGMRLLGIIDLVLDGETGAVICDFKTSARPAPAGQLGHEIQLTCYAYLWRCATAQAEQRLEVRWLVKSGRPRISTQVLRRRDEADLRRLYELARRYLDDLDHGRFRYRPGWHCALCPYRQRHCKHWMRCKGS